MAPIRKKPAITEGDGELRFAGYAGAVRYAIEGDPAKLRLGPTRMRVAFDVENLDVAADAFRAGDAALTLDTGVQLRVTMLGHTAGDLKVYGEVRV